MHAWRSSRVRERKSCIRGNSNHPPPTCEGTPFPLVATTLQETCLERMEHSSGQFGFGFEHAFASEQTGGLGLLMRSHLGPSRASSGAVAGVLASFPSQLHVHLLLKGAQVMCLIVRHSYVSVASCVSTLVLIRGFPSVGHARRFNWVLRPRCLVVLPRWKCQLLPHVCGHSGAWTA